MKNRRMFFFIVLVGCAKLVNTSCPSTCSCSNTTSGYHVGCNYKYLGGIPVLPNDTYSMNFAYNSIHDIDVQFCKEMPLLQTINIQNNMIEQIPNDTFRDCHQLISLYLHNNRITDISRDTFSNLTQLHTLYLYDNKIQSIESYTFVNMTNLYELRLHNNDISTIKQLAFVNLPSLPYLYLQHNELTAIVEYTFVELPSLYYLYLYDNKIQSIESYTFVNMTHLYDLRLSNNEISTIKHLAFVNLPSLRYLYLNNNKLTAIVEYTFVDLPSLYYLDRRTDHHSYLHFLTTCDGIVQDVIRLLKTDVRNPEYIDGMSLRLEGVARNVLRVASRIQQCYDLLQMIQSLLQYIQDLKSTVNESNAFRPGRTSNGKPGRPLYLISRDQLQFLLELGFSGTDMSKLLQVSHSTVKRRLRYFGISIKEKYSTIEDNELDDLIRPLLDENPHLGYRSIQAHVKVKGHICQENRIREAVVRVDPAGTAFKWSDTIHRRTYRVAGPNSLWHIDGNHKLISWRFVIHGGIDGFSRKIVFLGCATNNKSSTVFNLFLQATHHNFIPSRVRSDFGTENIDVAAFMTLHRGANRGSMIQGRSVHNQRIERLWLDLYRGCTNIYYDLFKHLEEYRVLDVESEIHIWALHYVYLPRIQRSLNNFQEMWNSHKLSSERGKTPDQLFVQGALNIYRNDTPAINDIFDAEVTEHFGIDWNGPVIHGEEDNHITVAPTNSPISIEDYAQLQLAVDPLTDYQNDYGISHFLDTIEFLNDCLNIG